MEEKIMKILEKYCEDLLEYDGDNMMEDGIIDSFMVVNIVEELEEIFDIEIDAKYVISENFKSKETIIGLMKLLLEEGK